MFLPIYLVGVGYFSPGNAELYRFASFYLCRGIVSAVYMWVFRNGGCGYVKPVEQHGRCLVEEGLIVFCLQVLLLEKMLGFGQVVTVRYIVVVRKRVRNAKLKLK